MKDQDFINHIHEQTENLPIPDSISPSSMKKMLEDHQNTQPTHTAPKKHHFIKGSAIAACLTLCVVGGIYSTHLFNRKADTASDQAKIVKDSKPDTSLVAQSSLQTPESYDEYYNTLKKAYDDYYDSIASVDTYGYDDYSKTDTVTQKASSDESEIMDFEDNFATNDRATNAISESAASKESGNSYSKTNTQEENVDEGDFIKTDGTYIYRMTTTYDEESYNSIYTLTITKTDNGNMELVYCMDLSKILSVKDTKNTYIDFQEFYLQNDQLYILYNKGKTTYDDRTTMTYIAVCSLKDKEQPKIIQNLSQSGYYVSSRISNGYLYTISNFCETSLDNKEKYEDYIPSVNGEIIDCSNLYYPDDILMETTYVITSLSLTQPSEFKDTKAFPNSGGNTYVSDSAIYLYSTRYNDITQTEISRIAYKDGYLTVSNSATITGYFYDSFALSEKDGYLRMVATIPANNIMLLRKASIDDVAYNDQNIVTEDVNALYILDKNMKLTGKLTGIAPGEQIYSARFIGDMGYFVTYENTDPLFSVDLSDPHNPSIVGKLKIPGFSNYLHPYGDDILLGIGEETDPVTGISEGVKLSMFDISDPENVTEKDKYIIENSEYSPALYDHKAIMINVTDNIFGFVYTTYDDKTCQYGYYFATYSYDRKTGFSETARYKLGQKNEYNYSEVRGIYIGDYLYLSNSDQITSYKLENTDPIETIYFN